MDKILKIGITSTIAILFTGCSEDNQTDIIYSNYIKATMDASYLGESYEYLNIVDTTVSEVKELYENTFENLAYQIMDYNNVNYNVISDEIIVEYKELAKQALMKSKYKVNEAIKINGIYQVKIDITPIDIWQVTYDEVEDYIKNFREENPKLKKLKGDELTKVEEKYAKDILNILKPYVNDMNYKNEIHKTVEIEFDDDNLYGISEEDWNDIDNYVMGIK